MLTDFTLSHLREIPVLSPQLTLEHYWRHRKWTRQNTSLCFQSCELERACLVEYHTHCATGILPTELEDGNLKDIWQDLGETFPDEKQVGKTFIHLLYDLRATCAYVINCKLTTDQHGNFTMCSMWRDVLLVQMSHVSQIESQGSYSIS